MNRLVVVLALAAVSCGAAVAQFAPRAFVPPIPAETPASPPPAAAPAHSPAAEHDAAEHKVKHHKLRRDGAGVLSADPNQLDGKTMRQNGRDGELRFAKGPDGKLQIVKFSLLGEVVSHPSQRCRIDIVAAKPLEAIPNGTPDGLPRFGADIPACPLTFDVVAEGVLVPTQSNACVFAAADCQASPSGLWGPAPADIESKSVARARSLADRSIQDSLHGLERRDKDAAASLTREESDFASERDDVCHDYAGEARLGFCASRLQESRAALLAKRWSEAGPAPKTAKKKHKS